MEEAEGRFEGAVRRVLDELEEEVITIVTHGTVISLLVARHNDLDVYTLWRGLGLPSFCVLFAEDLRLREAMPDLRESREPAAWNSYTIRSKCSTVGNGS